jgi:hypothetical protein
VWVGLCFLRVAAVDSFLEPASSMGMVTVRGKSGAVCVEESAETDAAKIAGGVVEMYAEKIAGGVAEMGAEMGAERDTEDIAQGVDEEDVTELVDRIAVEIDGGAADEIRLEDQDKPSRAL